MNKKHRINLILTIIFILSFLIPKFNNANEILIYADSITYDEDENIIAKGNAKVYQENQLIISELIIYNKNKEEIILPLKFIFKDEKNNFFQGENGFLKKI